MPVQLLSAKDTLEKPPNDASLCHELEQYIHTEQFELGFNRAQALLNQYPTFEPFRLALGLCAKKLGKLDIAIAAFLTILKNNPKQAIVLFQLGMTYYHLNQFEEALSYLEQTFEINHQDPAIAKNLSVIYYEYGLFDKAMYYCEQAIALDKDHTLQYGPALIQLAQGNYKQGWASYEYRLQKQGTHLITLMLPTPRWQHQHDLQGKILLLTWEQGFGDNIQFIRFVPQLFVYHPATIYLLCPHAIAPLFSQISGIHVLGADFAKSFDIPAHDYQISLPSLPYVLQITDESQLFTRPYLHADPEKIALINQKNRVANALQVGFCWSGNTQHTFNDYRSCGLDFFIPLLAYEHVQWHSLQQQITDEERETLTLCGISDLGSLCHDFADTAAAIASLDLIISIDTAIAHLAGAMGKPVWALLRYQTEWRHPRDREISPWYPSMRLIRQTTPGDWDSVRQQIETTFESQCQLRKLEDL